MSTHTRPEVLDRDGVGTRRKGKENWIERNTNISYTGGKLRKLYVQVY